MSRLRGENRGEFDAMAGESACASSCIVTDEGAGGAHVRTGARGAHREDAMLALPVRWPVGGAIADLYSISSLLGIRVGLCIAHDNPDELRL